jgi:hypothetical protein
MFGVRHGLASLFCCAALTGCASLALIHDPQTGVISRDEVPRFLKSVRCELSTFYQANLFRRTIFEARAAEAQRVKQQADRTKNVVLVAEAENLREQAVREGVHFPIAAELFGGVFMNLKVIDTLGIGAGDTNIVNKQVHDATHSETYGIAPTLNSQNTYEMTYSFLIDQGAGISTTPFDDPFKCYNPGLVGPGITSVHYRRRSSIRGS